MSTATVARRRFVATEGYKNWLAGGAITTPEAMNKVAALMRKDSRKGRSDGTGRFRSSLIGGCERKQALSFLGVEQNAADLTAATMGTWSHYRWQLAGLSEGFMKQIEIGYRRTIEGVRFSGQVDAILSDDTLFELKTTNTFSFKTLKDRPSKEHVAQVNLYLHLLGLGVGSLVYEERAFGDRVEFEVVYDYDLYKETLARAKQVLGYTTAGMLPRMHPECTPGSWMRKGCSFREVCLSRWVTDKTVPD